MWALARPKNENNSGVTLIDGNGIGAEQTESVPLQTETVAESAPLVEEGGITGQTESVPLQTETVAKSAPLIEEVGMTEQTESVIESTQPAEENTEPAAKESGAADNTADTEKNHYLTDSLTWEERRTRMIPCESSIVSYKRAFFGTDNSGYEVDKFHINNEKFLADSKVGSKVDDMFSSIDALKRYGQYGIPDKELKDLPEHLANIYMLGKLKETYPRREIYLDGLDEVDFNDIAEYNQIIMRFDQMKAAAVNMFRKSNLTESIINDPTGKVVDIVLNKDATFSNLIDASMKKADVFDNFQKAAMGENYVSKTSKAKESKTYSQKYEISFSKQ